MRKSHRLAVVGALAALLVSAPLSAVFASGEECPNCGAAQKAVRQVSIQEVHAISRGKVKGIIADSRTAADYKAGHIPGAISLPVDETWDGRLPKDKTSLVVFYCGGGACSLSGVAAQRALELGYNKVAIYKGGWQGWTQTASR
jgi:rhodanese-related sulfurtransferase